MVDAGDPTCEALLGLNIHRASDMDTLDLRGPCSVHGLGQVPDGVPTERHVLEETKHAASILGRNSLVTLQEPVEEGPGSGSSNSRSEGMVTMSPPSFLVMSQGSATRVRFCGRALLLPW